MSPDGSTVFVTGYTPLGMATVAYNAATGATLWVKNVADTAGTGVAVSPDGSEVFVTGLTHSGHYATFGYNSTSGAVLWSKVFHRTCAEALAAANPATPEVMVTGSCDTGTTGSQDNVTVAYSG